MGSVKEFCSVFFRRKSLSRNVTLETKLNRSLSTVHLIFFGIAQMAGAGIYVMTGHIIRNKAGPAASISFLLGGISTVFTALCYCEFATIVPKAGSSFVYTYILLGELPAFVIGWTSVLDVMVSMAAIAKGFSGAVNILTNNAIFNFTERYLPLAKDNAIIDTSVDLVAFGLILVLLLISYSGAKSSFTLNSGLTVIQVLCLLTISIACFVYGNKRNYTADGGFAPFGFVGIIQGTGVAMFAYSGFEKLANTSEESKNPHKSIPIAMFISLATVTGLYILASSGIPFMVPRLSVDDRAPFVDVFSQRNLEVFKWIAGVGSLLATGATKLAPMYVLSRVIYAISDSGLIFRFLSKLDKRTRSPVVALTFGASINMVMCLFVKLDTLADLAALAVLLTYLIVGVDLIIFRYIYHDDNSFGSLQEPQEMRFMFHKSLAKRKIFLINFVLFLISTTIMAVIVKYAFHNSIELGSILCVFTGCFVITSIVLLCSYKPATAENSLVPLMPVIPVISIVLNIMLMVSFPYKIWIQFILWHFIGFIIYFCYGIWHSDLAPKNENISLLQIGEKRYAKYNS